MATDSNIDLDTALLPMADHATEVPKEALGAVMFLTCLLSAGLLLVAPLAAKPVPEDKMWFLAPVNWPALALVVMAVTSAVLSRSFMRGLFSTQDRPGLWRHASWAFAGLPVDLIYGALFCGYLLLLSVAGFAISTWVFAQVCVSLSGLRGAKWWLWTLVFTAGLVLILRVGMGLWFPNPPLFNLLPHAFGMFCSRYL